MTIKGSKNLDNSNAHGKLHVAHSHLEEMRLEALGKWLSRRLVVDTCEGFDGFDADEGV